jgi:enoyl-CoA hydratase/carnithine racemase
MALEPIYCGLDASTTEALDFESALFGLLASTRDMREGLEAFLEKRRPDFKGR